LRRHRLPFEGAVRPCMLVGGERLKPGTYPEEREIQALERREHPPVSRGESKRPEEWDRTPHGRERFRARDETVSLARMKAGEKRAAIDRTSGIPVGDIDEGYGRAPIQPPHQRDFPPAKRAGAVVPDRELCHD
jgi:hypothetical protein